MSLEPIGGSDSPKHFGRIRPNISRDAIVRRYGLRRKRLALFEYSLCGVVNHCIAPPVGALRKD